MTDTRNKTMLTDLYQLTMDAAYLDSEKNDEATFDLFVRKLPKDWGFFVANGIEDAIDYATDLNFTEDDIEYLRGQEIFSEAHLKRFKDLKFTGEIYAVKEGTPVGPNTPLLRVRGPRTETQLLESLLLNTVNFQTLIASKASRIASVAAPAKIVDFGLRRAQGYDAAMKGARAAFIGGAVATSNVLAGKEYGIPIVGTQAHSFVMSFPTELESFRAYVKTFPDKTTLLIDTYDTLNGARNAAIVAKELEARGNRLGSVRLDSGDLAELSKGVRDILDSADLPYIKIVATNDLNEYKIAELKRRGARIDSYGVGTELITAKPIAAISGVYKLVQDGDGAKIKLSPEKKSHPGIKQVYRVENEGVYSHDILALESEIISGTPLLERVVKNGERISPRRDLREIREYSMNEVAKMPEHASALLVERPYELIESEGLKKLISRLTSEHLGGAK